MKKIFLSLLLVISLVSPTFATTYSTTNNIRYNVSQEEVLNLIYNNIHGTNNQVGNQYYCRVFCSPAIYLESGHCYIDWTEISNTWNTKDTAYNKAVQKYNLKSWTGKYNIVQDPYKYSIQLVGNTTPTYNTYNSYVNTNDPKYWATIPGPGGTYGYSNYSNYSVKTNPYYYTSQSSSGFHPYNNKVMVIFRLWHNTEHYTRYSTCYFNKDTLQNEINNYINQIRANGTYDVISYQ